MELKQVYTQLGILFLLMFFGYVLGKIKVIAESGIEAFSKFVVKVALPAVIISGMIIPLTEEKLQTAVYILALSIGTYGLAIALALVSSKLLIKDKRQRGVYSFALVFSNAAFMGYPVLNAMFGKEAIFYAAIYNITFNVLLYTLGIKLMESGNNEKNKFNYKLLINPGIIASVIGLTFFIARITPPPFIVGAVDAVAGLTTPLSMITIGAMLSSLPIRKMFTGIKVYQFAFIRLVILPILTLSLLRYVFRIESSWLISIPVVIAGMPVATNAAMIAKEYENDAELASQIILVTTLLSCITIPMLTYLL